MGSLTVGILVLFGVGLLVPDSASHAATGQPCTEITDLWEVNVNCEYTAGSLSQAQSSDPGADWQIFQLCKDGTSGGPEACYNPRVCRSDGTLGTLYSVVRDGVPQGLACLTATEATNASVNITQLAVHAFRRLDWPSSELTVQPPGGRTLVNLETIFFTTNAEPTVRSVTLAGREVQVEATPVSYDWDFGDGVGERTSSAGAAYPDHDVFHVYVARGRVQASVATTYSGRFRVGGGAWQPIDETLTVAGAPVGLEIVEAKPQLVAR